MNRAPLRPRNARPRAMRPADWAALARPRLSLAAALACGAGFVLQARGTAPALAWAMAGVLALCAGMSALNQVQERDLDALMERTRGRPLPSGLLRPGTALAMALAAVGMGLGLLWLAGGATPALLGLSAAAVYNGLYTPLKRRTSLALLAGAVAGALPPALGWAAAGGDPLAPLPVALTGAFLLWQGPHFWLLALRHERDYRAARLPVPSLSLPPSLFRGLLGLWLTALLAAWLGVLPHALALNPTLLYTLAPCLVLAAAACAGAFLRRGPVQATVNLAMAACLAALVAGALAA